MKRKRTTKITRDLTASIARQETASEIAPIRVDEVDHMVELGKDALRMVNALETEIKQLRTENAKLKEALAAIRDYVENPQKVGALGMTPDEKISGMWAQAVAGLSGTEVDK